MPAAPSSHRPIAAHSGRKAATAAALVQAGVSLLKERPEEALRRLLSAQDVARRAGVHRQTFYRCWPDPDEFIGAVVTAAMSPIEATEAVQPLLQLLVDQGITGAQELIHRAGALEYDAVINDPTMGIQTLVAGINGGWAQRRRGRGRALPDAVAASTLNHRLAEPLGDTYERTTQLLTPYYEHIAAGWGRRFPASFSSRNFAVVLTALVEGLALRELAQPGAVREQLYPEVIVALAEHFTEPVPPVPGAGDEPARRRLDDSSSLQQGHHRRHVARSAMRERNKEAIVDAAAFEFEMRGFEHTTMATIAKASGLGEATVFAHFGSKNMVAVHVFARNVPVMRDAAESDLIEQAPLDAIRAHLIRFGALVRAYPRIADAVLDAVRAASMAGPPTSPDDPRRVAPLPAIVVPAIEAAQAAAQLRADLPAPQVAAIVTNLTLLHALTRPAMSAEESVGFILALLVDGLAPR